MSGLILATRCRVRAPKAMRPPGARSSRRRSRVKYLGEDEEGSEDDLILLGLFDGTEFDRSYKRGKPATFRIEGVIAGWTEALLRMKPGAKRELFISSNPAYGERGAGSRTALNSTLIFEVELIKVN